MAATETAAPAVAPPASLRTVILASSLGTLFEWYDFYLYGTLAVFFVGLFAPAILVTLRLVQGLALGGEYGGAATYVAEHVPDQRRGFYTSFIQTTATLGFFLSLGVIAACRLGYGAARFKAFGWRVPFLLSFVLLALSLYIRLRMSESPLFARLK